MRTIALMMEAVSASETSVSIYQTARRNITEDSYLHTRRRENLNSHHTRALFAESRGNCPNVSMIIFIDQS
jgi:hypothetical protein